MIKKWSNVLKNHWIELLIVPPVLTGFGYLVYGEIYYSSVRYFLALTLPWLLFSIVVSILCNLWRTFMHQYFLKLEDWWKRLIFSVSGYILVHVLCFSILFGWLINLWVEEVAFVYDKINELIVLDFSTLLIITTLYEGHTFFNKWKEAITETEQLEKLSLESRFRSLQSQLNPHFLFNSFNVLSSLISESPGRAESFVDELSNVYRYLLRSNEKEYASVGDELRFIRSFFHLLQTRHGAGVSLKIDVSPAFLQNKVPTLVLQLLVENAVKHNEVDPEKPLLIEIFEKNGTQLAVRNNVQPKKTRVASNRVGLENLRKRYDLLGIQGFSVEADERFFAVSVPVWE